VTCIAAEVIQSRDPQRTFHVAKRYYRWLRNPHVDHRAVLKPAYAQTRALFEHESEEYILILLDFTNLEKPYGYQFESLCTLKASGLRTGLRCRRGNVPGYNQLVGLAVAGQTVGLTFAKTSRTPEVRLAFWGQVDTMTDRRSKRWPERWSCSWTTSPAL